MDFRKIYLLGLLVLGLQQLPAQYSLNELGVSLGAGLAALPAPDQFVGPALHGSGFYTHYFCGKAYGIQAQGGLGIDRLYLSESDRFVDAQVTMYNAEVAVFFKLRKNDYHRRKEWALNVGPVIPINFAARYRVSSGGVSSSQPLDEVADVHWLAPRIQASVQFRRPIGDLSFFIEPGASFGLLPAFSTLAGDYRRVELFLSFGYAVWDRRG